MKLSVLVSLLRHLVGAAAKVLSPFWDGPAGRYRPEDHYMRGPGPKCREKHLSLHTHADGI
jgi:hypothetical protein